MRILLLSSYFPKPGNPLLGTWALDQAKALARQSGCAVEVLSLTPWFPRFPGMSRGYRAYAMCPSEYQWDDLKVRYVRWPLYSIGPLRGSFHRNPRRWLRLAWAVVGRNVIEHVRKYSPDVLFAHHTVVNGWVAAQVASALRIPFVTQDHSYADFELCQRHPVRRELFSEVGRAAARMLVVSRRMAGALENIVPVARIGVIPNGADVGAVVAQPPPASARGRTVFSVGMLVERKGFAVLLRAWAEVARRFPDARLRLAGDGPERPRLLALRDSLGLAASVELLGYVSHQEVLNEMARARVFALASWNEPFGVVYTEAMAAGCSLVWGIDSGIAEVLKTPNSGYVVPPRECGALAAALIRLLTEDAEADAIGATNRALAVAHFSWDAVATQALAAFRFTLGED